jgi:nucleotide-binding universal stress UspA family protein
LNPGRHWSFYPWVCLAIRGDKPSSVCFVSGQWLESECKKSEANKSSVDRDDLAIVFSPQYQRRTPTVMALFDWFKTTPSNITVLEDVIWMTKQARLDGIAQELAKTLREPSERAAVIVVAHFQDSLDELQEIVGQLGSPELITFCKADTLERSASDWNALDESQVIDIVVGERHPLPAHDESLLEFARSLRCRSRVVHHLSLVDPLMHIFSGEWVESLLKRLGMAEDEAIESKLVARQIKKAQMKIARQAVGDSPADSAESWMERNCPEIWNSMQR